MFACIYNPPVNTVFKQLKAEFQAKKDKKCTFKCKNMKYVMISVNS